MAIALKQSTTTNVLLGPFVDKTDGVTAETGLAGAMAVTVSKNANTSAARNSATAIVHDTGTDGYYKVELDDTDTATLGTLAALVTLDGTHLPVRANFVVVPANVYDSLVADTDVQDVNVLQISGDSATADNLQTAFQTTLAESTAVPAANASIWAKIAWLATLGRNKITQTSTTTTLRNDADGADVATSAVTDDGTTATRSKWT